jgi:DNA repair protein RadC
MFGSPQSVKDWLTVALSGLEYEVFGMLLLDAQHRLIVDERLFRGTLTQTSIYPREVVKSALTHNAGAVILYHNHPSGLPEPSRADEMLTRALMDALKLIDVRTLDHLIVGGGRCVSFAERGLI